MRSGRTIDLAGGLRLAAPRSAMHLQAAGDEIRLDVDRLSGLRDLIGLARSPIPGGTGESLARAGLSLRVVVAGRSVALAGRGARSGRWFVRWMGLGRYVELKPRALVLAVVLGAKREGRG